jgi:DNA gyrase subunit A
MTLPLQLSALGRVIPTALHQEMERSYLEYAMSVIVGRALPDVRDGLKPVHRRIVYAMHELGLTPDRPFRKCARVVGDVLGKYHPHGDQSVYDALVRMVQTFSSRYPLLAGHGNFGSVDNDPAAAMRYTETRLASVATEALLAEISEAIVPFTANFDNSQQEPAVLPAQLPFLLLNGCSGIAVGMATNIPPHNLGEVVDGLVALINNPDLPDEDLWALIPGPDFPTGGEILDSEGIRSAYATGKGLIPVRGVTHLETIRSEKRRGHSRAAIIVTELPFQVNKAGWIEKVASLVNEGNLEGIADLRDESDRTGMRVVIELRRDADPAAILEKLYRSTALQSNFGAIFLALVENRPAQLTLRQILEEFLRFRENTLIRQYETELEETQQRLELVSGLLLALGDLDRLIEILRHAPDGAGAKIQLQDQFDLSPNQADAILAMPLRRVTGLERQKLQQERDDLAQRIEILETLLSQRPERLKALKKELRQLKKEFADPRRTRISSQATPAPTVAREDSAPKKRRGPKPKAASPEPEAFSAETQSLEAELTPAMEPNAPKPAKIRETSVSPLALFTPQAPPPEARLTLNLEGEIAWQAPTEIDPHRFYPYQETVGQSETLWIFTDSGKVYPLPLKEIPPQSVARVPLGELLPKGAQRDQEQVILTCLSPPELEQKDLILLTDQGRLKRLALGELAEMAPRGLTLLKTKEGERLAKATFSAADGSQNLVMGTSSGRLLRFRLAESEIPRLGRSAQGQNALRLRLGETLVGALTCPSDGEVLLLTRLGWGKRLELGEIRLCHPGDLGTTALRFTGKADSLLMFCLMREDLSLSATTSQGRLLSLGAGDFKLQDKDGAGELLADLAPEEELSFFSL